MDKYFFGVSSFFIGASLLRSRDALRLLSVASRLLSVVHYRNVANFLVTMRGTLAPGSVGEMFSHRLAIVSSLAQDAVAALAASTFTDKWNNDPSLWDAVFANFVTYTEATAAEIIGVTTGQLMAASHAPMTGTAGAGIDGIPTQNAIAVSLVAGVRPNGSPLKGRFYMPTPTQSAIVSNNGLLVTSSAQALQQGITQWFAALEAAGAVPCVWSRTYGLMNPVETVRVGNRVDTIRRRRNSQAETYV